MLDRESVGLAALEESNSVRDQVAKALYEHAVSEVQKKASEIEIPVEQIEKVLREAISTSDRSAAILVFALIDDIFISYYKQYLNSQIRGGISSLFDGFGILSTANSRITLAASLFWIDKPTYDQLNILRRIRNHFAHETRVSQFSDEPVKGLIHSLPKYEEKILKITEGDIAPLNDRKLFLIRATNVISYLVSDMTLMKHSLEAKIHPRSFGWDSMPARVKEVYRVVSGIIIDTIELKQENFHPDTLKPYLKEDGSFNAS